MRSDTSLPDAFREEKKWMTDPETGESNPKLERLTFYYGQDYHRHSYSGYERNKMFFNLSGKSFADLSGVSGVDNIADSRTWCALDYDRDGWTDIALVNANTPLLNLYRNRIGERVERNFIAIDLVGANSSPKADAEKSNRDAIGAVVTVTIGERELRRVKRCGKGFAARNSATLLIGIGDARKVDRISVRWPSKTAVAEFNNLTAGSHVVIRENAGVEVRPYKP